MCDSHYEVFGTELSLPTGNSQTPEKPTLLHELLRITTTLLYPPLSFANAQAYENLRLKPLFSSQRPVNEEEITCCYTISTSPLIPSKVTL